MDQLFEKVWKAITPSKIVYDNYNSRLHYQLAFGICLAATGLLGGAHLYYGPIKCISNSDSPLTAITDNRCFRKGPKRCLDTAACGENKCTYTDDVKDLPLYWYQHGIIILFFNAVVFRIGHQIWKFCEGGLMRRMYSDDAKAGNRNVRDEVLEEKMLIYQEIRGNHPYYYAKFVFSQFFMILVAIGIFLFNNYILQGGLFLTYGITIWQKPVEEGNNNWAMCNMFPILQTSCQVSGGGTGSGPNVENAVCKLNQNEYNQYIYLILWYLYSALIIVGVVQLMIEAALYFQSSLRIKWIKKQLGPAMENDTAILERISRNNGDNISDWFILYQIGKNMDKDYFMEFLRRVEQLPALNDEIELEGILQE